jgi:hypothetical protein
MGQPVERNLELQELQLAAARVHEAGHAAAATAVGYVVREVTVDDEGGGICYYGVPEWDRHDSPAGLWRQLVVCYAGAVAEQVLWSRHPNRLEVDEFVARAIDCFEILGEEDDGDDGHAAFLLRNNPAPETNIREAVESAVEILRERWPEVLEQAETMVAARPAAGGVATIDLPA